MNISKLIDKNYASCSILEDMEELFEWLKSIPYLVVINEELKVAGVVNQNDLINHPTGRIIDFDFSKPIVSPEISVNEVFKLMLSTNSNCLLVYE
jgi:CBS domain-containing protein